MLNNIVKNRDDCYDMIRKMKIDFFKKIFAFKKANQSSTKEL